MWIKTAEPNRQAFQGLKGQQQSNNNSIIIIFLNYGFRDLKYAKYYRAHQKSDILALVLLERQEHIKCH